MLLLTQFRYIYQPQTRATLRLNKTKMYIKDDNINNNIIKTLPSYDEQHKIL